MKILYGDLHLNTPATLRGKFKLHPTRYLEMEMMQRKLVLKEKPSRLR
jgi:hypothetical protein